MKKFFVMIFFGLYCVSAAYAWEQYAQYTNGRWIELPAPTKGSITLTDDPNKGEIYIGGRGLAGHTYRATLPDDRTVPYLKTIFSPVKPYPLEKLYKDSYLQPKTSEDVNLYKAMYQVAANMKPLDDVTYLGYKQPGKKLYTDNALKTISTVSQTELDVYLSDLKDPKAHGRRIRLEYPKNWEVWSEDGQESLNSLFDTEYSSNGLSGRYCKIGIIDMETDMTQTDWNAWFQHPMTLKIFSDEMDVLYSESVKLDGLESMLITREKTSDYGFVKLYHKSLDVAIGYKNTLIAIMCEAYGQTKTEANRVYEDSKGQFLDIIKSFKCLDNLQNQDNDIEMNSDN